ncbi:MAG: flagellar biosynthetic protein FliR [Chthoniobacteraceae bacterium]
MEALFDPARIYLLLLIFFRAGGLITILPVISSAGVPVILRLALAMMLSVLVYALVPSLGAPPDSILLIILGVAHEVVVGLLMGMAVRLLFYALEMAGQIIATEVGLIMSSSLDPITEGTSSPPTQMLAYFGAVIFFACGAHHAVIFAFARSFELVPPAAGNFDPHVVDIVVTESGKIFLLAVQMSAPLIAINFLVNFSLAILSKAAPTINAFSLSQSVQIIVGLALLSMSLGLTAHYLLRGLGEVPELMLRFIR